MTAPSTQWFLAEGATGTFFDLFILIANPSSDGDACRPDFLLTNGQVITQRPTRVAGNSRSRSTWRSTRRPGLASAHIHARHVHQRRADHRRALDVVAGARHRPLAGSPQ